MERLRIPHGINGKAIFQDSIYATGCREQLVPIRSGYKIPYIQGYEKSHRYFSKTVS